MTDQSPDELVLPDAVDLEGADFSGRHVIVRIDRQR